MYHSIVINLYTICYAIKLHTYIHTYIQNQSDKEIDEKTNIKYAHSFHNRDICTWP